MDRDERISSFLYDDDYAQEIATDGDSLGGRYRVDDDDDVSLLEHSSNSRLSFDLQQRQQQRHKCSGYQTLRRQVVLLWVTTVVLVVALICSVVLLYASVDSRRQLEEKCAGELIELKQLMSTTEKEEKTINL